jgi:tRNA splicing endonuclease
MPKLARYGIVVLILGSFFFGLNYLGDLERLKEDRQAFSKEAMQYYEGSAWSAMHLATLKVVRPGFVAHLDEEQKIYLLAGTRTDGALQFITKTLGEGLEQGRYLGQEERVKNIRAGLDEIASLMAQVFDMSRKAENNELSREELEALQEKFGKVKGQLDKLL